MKRSYNNRFWPCWPVLLLLCCFLPAARAQTAESSFSYQIYDQITSTYVNDRGRVNYPGLKKDLPKLAKFVDQLAAVSPENSPQLFPNDEERKRYYLTAYNALVLYFAARAYPDKHYLWSRVGYFHNKDIVLGGQKLSLDTLEHEIIRKQFLDPRIHFYINCGAKSCPMIRPGAIGPNLTDKALDQAARLFINSPDNVRFDANEQVLYLSKIFDWYEGDFFNYLKAKRGIEKPHIAQYILLYLDNPQAEALAHTPIDKIKIKYLDYDKSLNEQ